MAKKSKTKLTKRHIDEAERLEMPVAAIAKWADGLECLYCDLPLTEDEKKPRGVHFRCYQVITRFSKNKTALDALVKTGKLAPAINTGRPSQYEDITLTNDERNYVANRIAQLIANEKAIGAAEAELDKYIAKQKATKKATVSRKKAN